MTEMETPGWASTPSSLASTPRQFGASAAAAGAAGETLQAVAASLSMHLRSAASAKENAATSLQLGGTPALPGKPASASAAAALRDHAALLSLDADALTGGLHGARSVLGDLRRQLAGVQRDAVRHRQLAETALLERRCEVTLARSEAEAYRIATKARAAAITTLQRCAARARVCRLGLAWVCVGRRVAWGPFPRALLGVGFSSLPSLSRSAVAALQSDKSYLEERLASVQADLAVSAAAAAAACCLLLDGPPSPWARLLSLLDI